MTAPSMAEVLGEHQRITSQPGGPCWCGEWPRDNGRRETWMAHVAQALADAGFGHVASVEGYRAAARAALIEALCDEQAARCAYGTRDGDGRICDCKYGTLMSSGSEATGCAELRTAIRVLRHALDGEAAP